VLTEGNDAIRSYFVRVSTNSGTTLTMGDRRVIVVNPDTVLVTGFYEFTFRRNGQPVPTPSRFSMLLVRRNGAWLILHHHSSVLPTPPH
jgi:hypothetical protein